MSGWEFIMAIMINILANWIGDTALEHLSNLINLLVTFFSGLFF